MRVRDYAILGGVSAGTWGYGYIFGKPARMPTASTAAALGFTFATFLVLQDTRARLMGYQENSSEVQRYGLHPNQPTIAAQKDMRFPVATGFASPSTKPELSWKNYD